MKKKTYNPYNETYKDMWNTVLEAHDRLCEAVRKVILRKGVIDLYPAGADQNAAIKDCEEAKHSLLCAIGYYDGRMQELKEYFSNHYNELNECHSWHPTRMLNSHEIVELAYEQTIRG